MNVRNLFFILFIVSISSFTLVDHNNEIQLRLNKTAKYLDSNDRQARYFSYIIKISDLIQKNCAIYLRLLDSDGFQI